MSQYARFIELDEKRKTTPLTPKEAVELIGLANHIATLDPTTGPGLTIDPDEIIRNAGKVHVGGIVKVDTDLVNVDEHTAKIRQLLIQEQEARKRAVLVVAGIIGAVAKAAI